jgi:hypothetical protein
MLGLVPEYHYCVCLHHVQLGGVWYTYIKFSSKGASSSSSGGGGHSGVAHQQAADHI